MKRNSTHGKLPILLALLSAFSFIAHGQVNFVAASGGTNLFSTVTPATYISSLDGGSTAEYTLVADLNTDGRPDLVTIDRTTYAQRVWRNNGSGFTEVTSAGAASNPLNGIPLLNLNVNTNKAASQMLPADFDGDGDPDIYDSYSGTYYIQQTSPPAITSTVPADNGTLVNARDQIIINAGGTGALKVYPNPAKGFIKLAPPVQDPGKAELSIINQQGIRILRQLWQTGQQVDVSGLAPGMYMVRFSNGQQVYSTTFIKMR